MAFKAYPAKRYNAAGESKYINGPDEEAAGWSDDPDAKPAKAVKPAKEPKAQPPQE